MLEIKGLIFSEGSYDNNSGPADSMTSFRVNVLTSNFPEINAISCYFKNINVSVDSWDTDL